MRNSRSAQRFKKYPLITNCNELRMMSGNILFNVDFEGDSFLYDSGVYYRVSIVFTKIRSTGCNVVR